MKKDIAEKIVEKLEAEGYEARLYEGYSGRGMFGAETTGVVLRNAYDWERARMDVPELKRAKHDSLGKGVIFY